MADRVLVEGRRPTEKPAGLLRRAGRILAALACIAGLSTAAGIALSAVTASVAGAATERGTLYVGDFGANQIDAFNLPSAGGNVAPNPIITSTASHSVSQPYNMVPDAAGDLWVANFADGNPAQSSVVKFSAAQLKAGGDPTPLTTLTSTSIDGPVGVAFDAAGDMWVSNYSGESLVEFTAAQVAAGGNQTPAITISGANTTFDGPETCNFAPNGDLWIANSGSVNPGGDTLLAFTPAQLAAGGNLAPAITVSSTAGSLNYPFATLFDPSGNLWVSNEEGHTIAKFTPAQLAASGAPTPAVTLSSNGTGSIGEPWGLTMDGAGDLWVANETDPALGKGSVSEFSLAELGSSGSPDPITFISGTNTTFDNGPGGIAYIPPPPNYLMVGSDGGTFAFGSVNFAGSLPGLGVHVNNIVGAVPTPDGKGYLMIGSDGGTFAFGDANFEGSLPGLGVHVNNIVAVLPSPDDKGYLMVGSDGGTFAFGDATFEGSLPGIGVHVNNIVGAVPTPDGKGYLMIGSDGGTFAFGDATFEGSLPGLGVHVNNIVGVVPTLDQKGYLMIGSDGGTFAFGDANFEGSLPGLGVHVNNIVAVLPTLNDKGYLMVGSDGGTFTFGNAVNLGSLPGLGVHVSNIVSAISM
jgi:sugar lactone lactonase YvrE